MPADETLVVTIAPGSIGRLDKALAGLVPDDAALSRSRLMRMIAEGAVMRDGAPVTDPKAKVSEGQVYVLRLDPAVAIETLPEAIPLNVIFEDGDLIVINKPAGMVVHPAPGSPSGTLVNALLWPLRRHAFGHRRRTASRHRAPHRQGHHRPSGGGQVGPRPPRPCGAVRGTHRLAPLSRRGPRPPQASDPRIRGLRGVSFEAGGILRIATHLARHKTDRQRQAVVWDQGRHAVTRVRAIEAFGGGTAALVECWLETGRTHQIRVHMAYVGHGLLGDQTYGGKKRLSPKIFGAAARAWQRLSPPGPACRNAGF